MLAISRNFFRFFRQRFWVKTINLLKCVKKKLSHFRKNQLVTSWKCWMLNILVWMESKESKGHFIRWHVGPICFCLVGRDEIKRFQFSFPLTVTVKVEKKSPDHARTYVQRLAYFLLYLDFFKLINSLICRLHD